MSCNTWFPLKVAQRTPSFYPEVKQVDEGRVSDREVAEQSRQYMACHLSYASASDTASLLCSLIGFVNNSALDIAFNPFSKYFSFVGSLPISLKFMLQTGLAKELLFTRLTINPDVVSMMTTIQSHTSLERAHFLIC
jgi:hypothetical protein